MAIFSPGQREEIKKTGEAIGGILTDRWQAKEAEEFLQNEAQNFQNSTIEFFNSLSTLEDGDQMNSAFQQWKNNNLMSFITSATAKYANNPRIMAIVQKFSDANLNGMDQYMKIEKFGHERETREEREGLATQQAQAGIAAKQASAEADKARAGLLRRQTELAGAEQAQKQWPNLSQVPDLPTVRQAVQNARVNFYNQTQDIEKRTDQMATSQIIQSRMNQLKPDGRTKWGEDPAVDWTDASNEWLASGSREKVLEAAIAESMGANLAVGQGYYDEYLQFKGGALLPEDKVQPLRAGAPPSALLPKLLTTNMEDARQRGFDISNVNSFVKNTLPELPMSEAGYRQLGDHVTSILEKAVIRDADGQIISATDRKPVKTYNELVRHMLAMWNQRATNKLVASNATALQSDTETFGKAIIAKYAPIIAMRLGIPIPKAKMTELQKVQEPFTLQLIRGATEFAGDVVPQLLKYVGFGEEEL